ncbi:hypothetical protein FWK35_00022935, partial [Aphis craccivora]
FSIFLKNFFWPNKNILKFNTKVENLIQSFS